ncbi:HDOD domain-containing protein [Vibrio sp. JC009]|uniref:HDOD domain-containing protein n=1 Tax=Vibrio sp. JC009 TaxID=2912314 RepID=UPI0023AE8054|nr:HDOD domain-containing protein [Vibrio sp. JC009]WED21893.1 HDOD domain-containing protein [Vibrio sp. JC009]
MSQDNILEKVDELPRLEKVLHEILEMVNQIDFDFDELALKVSMDQMLSTKMLRMANSAQFGGRREVSSINEAIVRVGSDAVRTLVRCSVMSQAFPKLETLSLKDYWANTFEVSMIAGQLAPKVGLDPNEIFTMGTLHNMGLLLIHTNVPEMAKEITKRVEGGEKPFAVQREVLGTDVPTLGAKLAEAWDFPPQMVDAIAHSHSPAKAQVSKKAAFLLRFAIDVHKAWDSLFDRDKVVFVTKHPCSKVFGFGPEISDMIDEIRGEGYELAYQMFS